MIEEVFVTELGCELRFVDLPTESIPERPFGDAVADGVVISGSFGSANDQEPWRLALKEWLSAPVGVAARAARDVPRETVPPLDTRGVPRLGICGGHQIQAVAWGGVVGPAAEPQLGLFPLELEGRRELVVQLHVEAVLRPPEFAEVWAVDASGIQALRYPGHTWTVQFHPELSVELSRAAIERQGVEVHAEALVAATERGRAFIRRWIEGLERGAERPSRPWEARWT